MAGVNSPSPEGKKVFFVQPSSVIQREMVADLIRREFEVLLIPEAHQALGLFRRFPDCLAFLSIDEGPTEPEWEEFILEVHADPELARVRLGILTYNPDPELAQKYLIGLGVPCGYITLSLGLSESTATVARALEANEARGRRRFLRVHCPDRPAFNWRDEGGTLVEGRIVDLSTAGMACLVPSGCVLPKHSSLPGIQLKLRGRLCLVDGVVMGGRCLDDEGGVLYVVVFSPRTGDDQRDKIRAYLRDALQAQVEAELRSSGY